VWVNKSILYFKEPTCNHWYMLQYYYHTLKEHKQYMWTQQCFLMNKSISLHMCACKESLSLSQINSYHPYRFCVPTLHTWACKTACFWPNLASKVPFSSWTALTFCKAVFSFASTLFCSSCASCNCFFALRTWVLKSSWKEWNQSTIHTCNSFNFFLLSQSSSTSSTYWLIDSKHI
jgi:hypothetical protein